MKKLAVGVLGAVAVMAGTYVIVDCRTNKVGKIEYANRPTFRSLPLSYWDPQLATERTSVSEPTEIENVLKFTAPSYFTSQVDGKTRIAHRRFLPATLPERAVIVISNGRTENALTYAELIGDLTSRGYSVYIHDHAGQGFSDRLLSGRRNEQKGYVDDFARYVADLRTFVHEHVIPDASSRGNRPMYLLAHSMGGGVASLYLEQECCRHDFAAAVLVTPMHAPKVPGWWVIPGAKFMRFLHAPGYALGQGEYWAAPFADKNSDLTHSGIRLGRIRALYDEAAKRASQPGGRDPRIGGPTHGWLAAASAAGESAVQGADRISIPVLILQASDDTAVDNAAQGDFCRRVPRGMCQGFAIEKSYHAVFNETDTFRVPALTKILDFLEYGHRDTYGRAAALGKVVNVSGM